MDPQLVPSSPPLPSLPVSRPSSPSASALPRSPYGSSSSQPRLAHCPSTGSILPRAEFFYPRDPRTHRSFATRPSQQFNSSLAQLLVTVNPQVQDPQPSSTPISLDHHHSQRRIRPRSNTSSSDPPPILDSPPPTLYDISDIPPRTVSLDTPRLSVAPSLRPANCGTIEIPQTSPRPTTAPTTIQHSIHLPPPSDTVTLKFESDRTQSTTPGTFSHRQPSRLVTTRRQSSSLRSVSVRSPVSGRRLRKADLHPGSNRFFCAGRLVGSGDSPWPLCFSACCAVGIPVGFLVTHAEWLWTGAFVDESSQSAAAAGKAIIFIYSYVLLVMLSSMAMTSFTDPGIIPRNLDPDPEMEWIEEAVEENEERLKQHGRIGGEQRAKARWIDIGKQSILTKWCPTCQTYRPPRTSHCRLCDNCVEQSDHHCTFLNNCIGRRNYFTFLVFLITTTTIVGLSIGFGLAHIVTGSSKDRLVIGTYVVVCLTFIVGAPVVGLTIFHSRLVAQNLTTIETLRTREPGFEEDDLTVHALSSVWENCVHVACRPARAMSWINASAHATCDMRA